MELVRGLLNLRRGTAALFGVSLLAVLVSGRVQAAGPPTADVFPGGLKDPGYAPLWNGPYFGVHGGYASSSVGVADIDGKGNTFSNDGSGAFGGGTIGYNWLFGHVVYSAEIDLGVLDVAHTSIDPALTTVSAHMGAGVYGDIAGRIGYAFDRTLVYAKGGFGFFNGDATVRDPSARDFTTKTQSFTGWTLGAGVEYKITPNWSVKAEYLHFDLGDQEVRFRNSLARWDNTVTVDTVKVGLNYEIVDDRASAAGSLKDSPKDTSTASSEAADNLGFFGRFYKAYADEWGKTAPPADPNVPAPIARRPAPFPPAPLTQPPYPFTDWPYGGSETIGASIPNAVDSPLMTAFAPTGLGQWMDEKHIQVYGWVNAGGNLSTARGAKDGNYPAAYMYKPNTVEWDQAVVYVERVPDTVQQDHVDWGFRFSTIYGENYRYTTAYGVASYQLLKHNHENGYDFPMVYGEVYIPKVAEGLVIRAGRYISVPDIEAQLAPNNYTYSHSMTYAYDNYTNTGIIGTLQATKNWELQTGITAGTETVPWNSKDPGTQPSLTSCARWNSYEFWLAVNVCA